MRFFIYWLIGGIVNVLFLGVDLFEYVPLVAVLGVLAALIALVVSVM
jgi:hypothetical protein